MSEKKKVRFTVLDAVVLLVILVVAVFVGMKFFGPETGGGRAEEKTYTVRYYAEEVPEFAAELIKAGDTVTDASRGHSLGKVVSVETGDAAVFFPDERGQLQKSGKEGYRSVTIYAETEGTAHTHGVTVAGTLYVTGHSMKLYVGGAELTGYVAGIEEKQ